ncbi:MAG: hypothetical protein II655_08845, partial [Thermoguttaceae bacterium]|nr:hypothetical protein [Thermoguttaceae bacterium]
GAQAADSDQRERLPLFRAVSANRERSRRRPFVSLRFRKRDPPGFSPRLSSDAFQARALNRRRGGAADKAVEPVVVAVGNRFPFVDAPPSRLDRLLCQIFKKLDNFFLKIVDFYFCVGYNH